MGRPAAQPFPILSLRMPRLDVDARVRGTHPMRDSSCMIASEYEPSTIMPKVRQNCSVGSPLRLRSTSEHTVWMCRPYPARA